MSLDATGADNFTPLTSLDWQVHVYGDPPRAIHAACKERSLPLHVFPWTAECGHAGFRRDAVYLVRPDGYVGLADPEAAPETLTSYLDARNLRPVA